MRMDDVDVVELETLEGGGHALDDVLARQPPRIRRRATGTEVELRRYGDLVALPAELLDDAAELELRLALRIHLSRVDVCERAMSRAKDGRQRTVDAVLKGELEELLGRVALHRSAAARSAGSSLIRTYTVSQLPIEKTGTRRPDLPSRRYGMFCPRQLGWPCTQALALGSNEGPLREVAIVRTSLQLAARSVASVAMMTASKSKARARPIAVSLAQASFPEQARC